MTVERERCHRGGSRASDPGSGSGSDSGSGSLRAGRLSAARSRRGRPGAPWYFLLPALLVGGAMLLPFVYLVVRAAETGSATFFSLITRPRTGKVLLNTVGLAAAVAAGSVALGVPLAWLTTRTDLPGRKTWSVLAVLPLAVPSLVGAFAFVSAWGQGGLVHELLRKSFGPVAMPDLHGFLGAWLVLTLLSFPYVVLSVRGALLGMDPGQEEAARSLGHGPAAVFTRVLLPQLRPAIAAGALLSALYTLSDFAAVSLLRFESFTQAIYVQYQATFNRSYAAVLALVLVALTGAILLLESRARGRASQYRVGAGSARGQRPVPLGRWKIPALLFCGLVALLSVAMPFLVNAIWLLRGIMQGRSVLMPWDALLNSIYASLLGAAVAAAAALPVAIVAVRHPSRLSAGVERTAYVGYALPGIVVALSLVFFGANYAYPLYQTMALLVFAYVVLFLPQALASVRTSLLQVTPNVENAARSLGLSPWQVTWRVTVPLVRPGIVTGAVLVFLTIMKELPATLLLSPLGFRTLAMQIWGAVTEAYYIEAAAPSLLLMVASSVSVAILLRNEGSKEG